MRRLRGESMIGVLVAVAIVIALGIAFAVGSGAFGGKVDKRPDGKGETLVGRSMYRAKDEACRSNLGQVRQSLQIATDPTEDTHPASLQELHLGDDFMRCPIGKEPYEYDPATGTVKCVHPGHEKY
ncbi:MAG: hypothetical protein JSS66_18505 [Armatimonadetes bacterium]|nr:hypothetical protein [Armatimonadota bacterium]